MATEKQLRFMKKISSVFHVKFTGDINNPKEVSNFIGKYAPILREKSNEILRTCNKNNRYMLSNYKLWKL